MILDLLVNESYGGLFKGKVRIAVWSEEHQSYSFRYEHCDIWHSDKDAALMDARDLAFDVACDMGLQVVDSQMEYSMCAIPDYSSMKHEIAL